MYTYSTTYPDTKRRSASLPQNVPIVFIIDADPAMRDELALVVRSAGLQPEAFSSAREFLSHSRPPVPSCLVLDVNLPDLNGLDLQKQSHPSGPTCRSSSSPVIGMSR